MLRFFVLHPVIGSDAETALPPYQQSSEARSRLHRCSNPSAWTLWVVQIDISRGSETALLVSQIAARSDWFDKAESRFPVILGVENRLAAVSSRGPPSPVQIDRTGDGPILSKGHTAAGILPLRGRFGHRSSHSCLSPPSSLRPFSSRRLPSPSTYVSAGGRREPSSSPARIAVRTFMSSPLSSFSTVLLFEGGHSSIYGSSSSGNPSSSSPTRIPAFTFMSSPPSSVVLRPALLA